MKTPSALFGLLLLLPLFCGCDQISQKLGLRTKAGAEERPQPTGTPVSEGTNTVAKAQQDDEAAQFNADYEKWQIRTVAEFPEVGKAGSRFNQQFLLATKKLRENNALELAHPNWPSLLALRVNTTLERSKNSPSGQSIRAELIADLYRQR